MNRIFLTLSALSAVVLVVAFVFGLNIGDLTSRDTTVQATFSYHFLTAVAALIFAMLVHAIVLTYFMGTGRWMEDTGQAYGLAGHWQEENQALKSRFTYQMVGCLLLLILTGATGAAADPASPADWGGSVGLSGAMLHFLTASATLSFNLLVNIGEYQAIVRNGVLVDQVLAEVRRIREERGLPV